MHVYIKVQNAFSSAPPCKLEFSESHWLQLITNQTTCIHNWRVDFKVSNIRVKLQKTLYNPSNVSKIMEIMSATPSHPISNIYQISCATKWVASSWTQLHIPVARCGLWSTANFRWSKGIVPHCKPPSCDLLLFSTTEASSYPSNSTAFFRVIILF